MRFHHTKGEAAACRGFFPFILMAALFLGVAPRAQGADAPDTSALIAKGKSLFISYGCGWCHEGGGRKPGKCPQLMGTERDDNFILSRIATGSEGKMPAFGEALGESDLHALLTYIRSLKPETGQ
jgi:mono/diheme cytochrome c family protein